MITSIAQNNVAGTILVTVASSLTAPVYYFWYLDGNYIGMTSAPRRTFVLSSGSQVRIDVLDSTNPAFDAIANAPQVFPATRTLFFVRSIDPAIARYRIEQNVLASSGPGSFLGSLTAFLGRMFAGDMPIEENWQTIGFLQHDPRRWSYTFRTGRLADLTSYAWRVIPLDFAGNTGPAVSLGQELIVRTPDAPRFTVTDSGGATAFLGSMRAFLGEIMLGDASAQHLVFAEAA